MVWGEGVVPVVVAVVAAVGAAGGFSGAELGAEHALVGAAFAGGPDFGVFGFGGVDGFVGVVDGPVAVGFVDGSGFACHGLNPSCGSWDAQGC